MDEAPRIVRPKLDRTGPIRAFSGMFRGSEPHDGNGNGNGNANADGHRESRDGVVARSVELGYRVVEDYLRAGQRTAEHVGERPNAPGGGLRDFQDLAGRMARYASDLTEIWFQLMELTTRGGAAAALSSNGAANTAPLSEPSAEPELGSSGIQVTVEIVSTRPVEVSLDLRPGALTRSTIVHALRAADSEKPRLTEVRLSPATVDTPPKLVLRVPPGQPPGVYSGLVIDELTSRPLGTVSASVAEEPSDG